MVKPFPVTAKDDVLPSDPALEPSRADIAANPEDDAQRIERTRRYFRLTQKAGAQRYARGLDTLPEDFA